MKFGYLSNRPIQSKSKGPVDIFYNVKREIGGGRYASLGKGKSWVPGVIGKEN